MNQKSSKEIEIIQRKKEKVIEQQLQDKSPIK